MTCTSIASSEAKEEDCPACPYSLVCLTDNPDLYSKLPIYLCDRCHRLWMIDRKAGRSYRCKEDRTFIVMDFSRLDVWVCYDCVEAHLATKSINDDDRSQWIDNDEGLYDMWRGSGLSKREFIRRNREMLTHAIRNVTENKRPAHYLKYGG